MASILGNRVGQKLGNCQLKRLVGQGSFAEVYLAEHEYLKTQIAVKVLHIQLAREDQESFLHEARILARLRHPHILSVLEFGIEDGIPFLVMDYAPKGSLRERFPRHSRPTPLAVLPFLKQTAAALSYAHQEKIVHRDVKPENMLLGEQDELLLSDFGMSLGIQSSRTQNMADVAGTIAYMAPEQIQGRPVPASDQYSLALVIYELLSGDLPFSGSFSEIASQQVMAAPPPIQAPAVSPEVEAVIQRALAKDPQQRFPSVQAFADAFEQAALDVGGTLRAPDGWLPPCVRQQVATVPSIKEQPTTRKNSGPTTEKILTLAPADDLGVPSKKRRKGLSRVAGIAFLALALLIAISGVAYLGLMRFGTAQMGSLPQGDTSAQTGVSASAWQARYTQITSQPPILSDSLKQSGNGWESGTDAQRSCLFTNGVYHVKSQKSYNVGLCGTGNAKIANLSDIAYQVQMTIISGNEGGIFFRLSLSGKNQFIAYLFSLNSNGTYNLWAIHTYYKTLLHSVSSFIKPGLNQSNLITVIAKGKLIALYVNNRYVDSIVDNSATTGRIGLFAQDLSQITEVAFSNLVVWKA